MKRIKIIAAIAVLTITTIAIAQNQKSSPVIKKKFTYSRLVYNYLWDKLTTNESSKYEYIALGVAEELAKKIKTSNLTEGLNLMGDNGWELVSTTHEEINLGTQYVYYFKKDLSQ